MHAQCRILSLLIHLQAVGLSLIPFTADCVSLNGRCEGSMGLNDIFSSITNVRLRSEKISSGTVSMGELMAGISQPIGGARTPVTTMT